MALANQHGSDEHEEDLKSTARGRRRGAGGRSWLLPGGACAGHERVSVRGIDDGLRFGRFALFV